MKTLRRIFSSWHNLIAGILALTIYLLAPLAVRWYDPTAGVFDGGYLLWVALATFVTLWAGFVGWVLWQLIFPSIDRATASKDDEWGGLREWFNHMSSAQRWWATQISFAFCVCVFLYVLKLIPLS
jgi:hypothetical protein